MSGKALLSVRGLDVVLRGERGDVHAVRDMSFELARGEVLAIIGASGAGKSMTASAIAGLAPPTARVAGTAAFDGIDLLDAAPAALRSVRGSQIAFAFQDAPGALNPVMRIGAQIAEQLGAHGSPLRGHGEQVLELLRSAGVEDAARVARAFPHELSGGLAQRAQIAMAVALGPELLIADEPTSALDVSVQAEILGLLRSLNEERGMAILLITHDPEIVAELATRVLVIDGGELVEEGSTGRILSAPSHPSTRDLLTGVAPPRPPRTSLAGGHSAHSATSREGEREPLLEVEGLVKRFRGRRSWRGGAEGVTAVDGVSFSVAPGETFAVVGESGSGKTTLARSIVGLEHGEAGSIAYDGSALRPLGNARRGFDAPQMVFQDAAGALNPRKTVAQIVGDPLIVRGERAAASLVNDLLERVGLEPAHAGRFPHELSGGQRQRVGIARALSVRPRLIVADEPVSALDAAVQAQVMALLDELRDQLGLACVLIAHDLGLVRRSADRVAVMQAGRFVEVGAASDVLARPSHPYTHALLAAEPRRAAELIAGPTAS